MDLGQKLKKWNAESHLSELNLAAAKLLFKKKISKRKYDAIMKANKEAYLRRMSEAI